ncbi:hypothetical protein PIROE2DRAFT_39417 [Piromyces sp. E2]|nr:hypothetical protein PIROE2DRAFT_39417 [Piromyces sp. E2]|eukprot:OUM68151.1 hypothetical protein PIROE2DRAFT_39417 [Piromyces sp. E2]
MIDVWHDCDPGHDDAIALMYCLSEPQINLVGISTVHGNQESYKTFKNALRILYITGNISKLKEIKVISGANKPIKRKSQICEEIHGQSGLGGVDWKEVDKQIEALGINLDEGAKQNIENVVDGIHQAYKNSKNGKLTLLITGCHTNIAAYAQKYPDDIKSGNINVVAMGGSIDTFGNTGPWSEFNIEIDPEAFDIVLKAFQTEDKKKSLVTLIPVDVTHTVLSTPEVINKLDKNNKFENLIIHLLNYFKETYKNVFNFSSPPVHDPVAAYYIVHPEEFTVDHEEAVVELEGKYTSGTICINRYPKVNNWCDPKELQALDICRKVNVNKFWDEVIDHLHDIAKKSPL